jgi:hypothetical protein
VLVIKTNKIKLYTEIIAVLSGIRTKHISSLCGKEAEFLDVKPGDIYSKQWTLVRGGKDGRCVELTTLPPSCADCLEILEPQLPGTPRACPGL